MEEGRPVEEEERGSSALDRGGGGGGDAPAVGELKVGAGAADAAISTCEHGGEEGLDGQATRHGERER